MRSRRARSPATEAVEMPDVAASDATRTRLVRVELACSAVAVTATLTPGKTDPPVAAGGTAKAEPTETEAAADAADAVLVPATCVATAATTPPSRPATPSRGNVPGHGTRAGWKRPALETCAPEDFMFDFLRAAEARGDDWECVWDFLDNALRRTGKPCDVLGLYREVCMHGGYITRESAKRRVKMGHVFAQTHNFYRHHTYTDIGNKLLDLYERFLLPYENEHPEDILVEPCAACGDAPESQSAGVHASKARCDACRATYHRRCAGAGAFQRASRVERFTSFVCAACVRSGSRDDSNEDVANATVVTVVTICDKESGSGSPTRERKQKRTLAEIDARGRAAADEAAARSVAMRVPRARLEATSSRSLGAPTWTRDLVGPAL